MAWVLLALRAGAGIMLSLGAADVVNWFRHLGKPAEGPPGPTPWTAERTLLLAGLVVMGVELWLHRKGRFRG
jgi:hypothetical protein